MTKKSWKDHLLSSGIPLERDIKKYLDEAGCISDYEFSYFRPDENSVTKTFSYDIDASYITGEDFVNYMIECKYRHESTKWIFIPEEYFGPNEIFYNSFMHPNQHFVKRNFQFDTYYFPRMLAPLCSKGIEIISSGTNEKSINQAIAQLSFAFAQKMIEDIYNQIVIGSFENTIFYNVPIIITSAKLYRLNENIDISAIKKAEEIDDVATNYNCLVIRNIKNVALKKYNQSIFNKFLAETSNELLKSKLNSFNDDLNFVFNVISEHYCPSTLLVVHYSESINGLEQVLNYINDLLFPPPDLSKEIENKLIEIKKKSEKLKLHKK